MLHWAVEIKHFKNLDTHTQPFNGPLGYCPGSTTRVIQYQKVNQEGKTNLDLLEQEIESGSGISWAICKSAP